VETIIFRGSERNKRRGFHNLYVLNRRLHHQLGRSRVRARARLVPSATAPQQQLL
jgi:hypothetical protein